MSERKGHGPMFSKFSVILVLMVAILLVGCSRSSVSEGKEKVYAVPSSVTSSRNPTNGMVQSNTGGSVTIDVEWHGGETNSLVFYVSMNTHSVDLDRYDLKEITILRDDEGKEYGSTFWDSAPGGHHRSGTLAFSLPDSVSQEKTKYVEMIIRDVAGIEERVLKWEL